MRLPCLLALILLFSCDQAAEPDPPRPAVVAVTPATAEMTALGVTVQLVAAVRDQNGQPMPSAPVTWTSGAPEVATVDGTGMVTAVANGTAAITATAGTVSARARVTVAQVVESVAVTPAEHTLVEADTVRLSAVALDANDIEIAGVAIAWASVDTLVAFVDASGLVTGVVAGVVAIEASAPSGVAGQAEIKVVAPVATTVAVSPDTVGFPSLGDTMALSAEVFDQVGRTIAGVAVVWSSGDTTIAVVDSAGVVTAVAKGTALITAQAGAAAGTAAVMVAQVARLVTVTPSADTVELGDTLRLSAEAFDANGHRIRLAEFDWTSSDTAVALVDDSGLVTGRSEGAASITASAGDASAVAEITVENPDRAALWALYGATGGPNWRHKNNWLTDKPLGEWQGVGVNDEGRVTSLYLSDNGLDGEIPPELGNLTALESLRISEIYLTGPIPAELGKLTSLTRMRLFAEFTGEIPPELGDLALLEELSLGGSSFSGPIPPELGQLSALKSLGLVRSNLTGPIPPELGKLSALEQLFLEDNDLTGPIPAELGNLSALERLGLSGNNLTGAIPLELLDLPLHYVGVSGNALCLPGTDGFLRWLRDLDDFFGEETWCTEIDRSVLGALYAAAGGSAWKRSDGWFGDSPVLSGWHGVTTDSLGRVKALSLPANGLAGGLSSVPWEALDGLRVLDVAGNSDLHGSLPLRMTRTSLDTLRYFGTGLCVLEKARGWLESIHIVDGNGQMCAPLSDRDILIELYEVTDGVRWKRSDNWLTDAPLGEWYGVDVNDEGRVISLHLQRNALAGSIPLELGYLSALKELDLSANRLIGPIPPELGKLHALEVLRLGTNSIRVEGGGPPVLPADRNALTGLIPLELGDLAALKDLRLHNNSLTGRIPPELGRLVALKSLLLSGNNLSGPIPNELGNLAALESLHLEANALSGTIPQGLGNLAALKWLGLEANVLSGPIPADFGNLTSLGSLLLRENQLSGSVPRELGKLPALTALELSQNEGLSGALPATLTALELGAFSTANTGLCAPADSSFQQWFNAMELYRVQPCGPSVKAYLVQSVQSRDYPVPLVAGRDALLRVFPTVRLLARISHTVPV